MVARLLMCATLTLAVTSSTTAGSDEGPPETPAQRDARLAWWREARFGMFVHWGPVSIQGTEIGWSRAGERRGYSYGPGKEVPVETYDALYTRFDPTNYNPDEWVSIARDAGMKYVVLTSRHHDGFSMFDTKASDYRVTSPACPHGRDIVGSLAESCHRAGMRFGLYYSQPDWHHPDAFTPRHDRYLTYLKTQLMELLSNYGTVDYLFFDGLSPEGGFKAYGGPALNELVRRLQPQIVLNDRNGPPSDFDTPEQRIGGFQLDRPWETCMTLGTQWSYRPNDRIKSLEECVQTLARCAGGDGNLLLNVGPMPTGQIEPRQAARLREIGAWLKTLGESISGTRGGPFRPSRDYACTRAGNSIYLHVFRWDGEQLNVPRIDAKVVAAKVLPEGTAAVEQSAGGLIVTVKKDRHNPIDTVVRLELDRPASGLSPALH
ncbi:MAG: alpha-L-fucosidase [Isosphaeraceae bacterium]